jgi:hypothetical protein
MKGSVLSGAVVAVLLAATASFAQEVVVASNVLGPEGPLSIDGKLRWRCRQCAM